MLKSFDTLRLSLWLVITKKNWTIFFVSFIFHTTFFGRLQFMHDIVSDLWDRYNYLFFWKMYYWKFISLWSCLLLTHFVYFCSCHIHWTRYYPVHCHSELNFGDFEDYLCQQCYQWYYNCLSLSHVKLWKTKKNPSLMVLGLFFFWTFQSSIDIARIDALRYLSNSGRRILEILAKSLTPQKYNWKLLLIRWLLLVQKPK